MLRILEENDKRKLKDVEVSREQRKKKHKWESRFKNFHTSNYAINKAWKARYRMAETVQSTFQIKD